MSAAVVQGDAQVSLDTLEAEAWVITTARAMLAAADARPHDRRRLDLAIAHLRNAMIQMDRRAELDRRAAHHG